MPHLRRGHPLLVSLLTVGSALAQTWQPLAPAAAPSPRQAHRMATDTATNRVVLFGGFDPFYLADTWEWDGTNWTMVAAGAPTARVAGAMAVDPLTGHVLMFGGVEANPYYPPSTWIYSAPTTWLWDGFTWNALPTAHAPTARAEHAMATDVGTGHVILYGGSNGVPFDETWQWDGADWQLLATTATPAVPTLPAMAAAPGGHHVVLFGGANSGGANYQATWQIGHYPLVSTFGTGCGSPATTLTPDAGSLPVPGQTFQSTIGNVPAGGVALQLLGISDTSVGGAPLPLDLTFAGMPGCMLYQDMLLFAGCTDNGNGTATHSIALPNSAALVDGVFYAQGCVLFTTANPAGIVTTNALAVTVGYP